MKPNKKDILEKVIAEIESSLMAALRLSKEAHTAATHEESKAEDKYDTRGLEASYLAGAQSQRAEVLEKSIHVLKEQFTHLLQTSDSITVGSLVHLKCESKESFVFLLPYGAGVNFPVNGKKIQVVTLQSPLGMELEGKSIGDTFEWQLGANSKEYEILNVF